MRVLVSILAVAAVAAVCLPAGAQAAFGIDHFDVTFTNEDASAATQAGSHPFAFTTSLETEGELRDLVIGQPSGLVADSAATPRCAAAEFEELEVEGANACPASTAVGIATSRLGESGDSSLAPVFNLAPPSGVLMRLGFRFARSANVVFDVTVNPGLPHNLVSVVHDLPQSPDLLGLEVQLWGNPASPAHDEMRGVCGVDAAFDRCPVSIPDRPFLTLPTACEGPLVTSYLAVSLEGNGVSGGASIPGLSGCRKLAFSPQLIALPTTEAADSPTGLDLSVDQIDPGLENPEGIAASQIRDLALALPEGMSLGAMSPKADEVCSEVNLANETLKAAPGDGCPQASRIGTLEVESQLAEGGPLDGAVYRATPFENLAEDSPEAVYIVLKDPALGVIVKQPAGVEPDPETGQLLVFAEDIPQLPFSHLRLHIAQGASGPLISPPLCGSYEADADLTPWSGESPLRASSAFAILTGPSSGPCPSPGGDAAVRAAIAGPVPIAAATGAPLSSIHARRRRHRCAPHRRSARRAGKLRCKDRRHGRHKRSRPHRR